MVKWLGSDDGDLVIKYYGDDCDLAMNVYLDDVGVGYEGLW